MPASDISRITHSFRPGVWEGARAACASAANRAAKNQVADQIRAGILSKNNPELINSTYKQIYYAEYYRNMNEFEQSNQVSRLMPDFIETDSRGTRKFPQRHTPINFSRLNCFVHVHRCSITVGRYNFPLDRNESPETKEAFISTWPGPLDKLDTAMKSTIIEYINRLLQHDPLRRIKYSDSANNVRRNIILNLLGELIRQDGSINAAEITRLLLGPKRTEINIEDSNRYPEETIQKYLLHGNRSDAIRFARTKGLYDHAQCLAFLNKYQPPNTANYTKDSSKLKDDSIVSLNDDYISSIRNTVLNTVYRSLLNRILETDLESTKIVKRPNVGNKDYEFAILSANDCEMDFDQSNEVFKLIRASKRVHLDPVVRQHMIALGFTYLDDMEPLDDMSNRSHLSFKLGDNYVSRTLIISNFDMLILNEIWEYCLNLARRRAYDYSYYEYITNLIPYKLVFASCLFDFGLHNMFAQYIDSIGNSIAQARAQQYMFGDTFYNWTVIERSVEHLRRTWELFQSSSETQPQSGIMSSNSISYQADQIYDSGHGVMQPIETVQPSTTVKQNDVAPHSYRNDWDVEPIEEPEYPQQQHYQPQPSLHQQPQQYQQQSLQQQFSHQQSVQQETLQQFPQPPSLQLQQQPQQQHFDTQESYPTRSFNMEPLANQLHSLPDMSTYQRPDYPDSSQLMKDHNEHKSMKSSSPVSKNRASMGDSFPFSPIQENIDPQSDNSSRRESAAPNDFANDDQMSQQQLSQAQTSGSNNVKSQSSGDQQNNFLASLVGTAKSLLPKSNSKPMILPDSDGPITWDDSKKRWVDKSNPNGTLEDEVTDAPPIMNSSSGPSQYSFKKSSRSRYPDPKY